MQDFAYLVRLFKDGGTLTLWSGEPRGMVTVQEGIDRGLIATEGLYLIGIAMQTQASATSAIPYWLAGDIFTVSFNDHGELTPRFGFAKEEPVSPRRIHRWPH